MTRAYKKRAPRHTTLPPEELARLRRLVNLKPEDVGRQEYNWNAPAKYSPESLKQMKEVERLLTLRRR